MYEQYFSTFEYVDSEPYCKVRLIHPQYGGVEAIIAKQFQIVDNNGQQEIKFDYQVTDIPEGFDRALTETEDFIGVLRNVFMAILEKELQKGPVFVKADQEKGE
jgi:prophage DNA circulation protein